MQFVTDLSTNIPGDPFVSPTIAIILFCLIFVFNTATSIVENLNYCKPDIIATLQEVQRLRKASYNLREGKNRGSMQRIENDDVRKRQTQR